MRIVLLFAIWLSAAGSDLSGLAWFEGRWRASVWEGTADEMWTGPLGGTMVGVFRFTKGDKFQFTEMMHIESEGSDIYLRLKHFNFGLKGWEEKNDNVSLKLIEQTPGTATFLRADGANRLELRFKKVAPNRMDILMLRTSPKGATQDLFAYTKLE